MKLFFCKHGTAGPGYASMPDLQYRKRPAFLGKQAFYSKKQARDILLHSKRGSS
jgi:hypothetical protein